MRSHRKGHVAIQIPTTEVEQRLEDGFVPNPMEVRLRKVTQTVNAVYHPDDDAHGKYQCRIQDQFVEVADG